MDDISLEQIVARVIAMYKAKKILAEHGVTYGYEPGLDDYLAAITGVKSDVAQTLCSELFAANWNPPVVKSGEAELLLMARSSQRSG